MKNIRIVVALVLCCSIAGTMPGMGFKGLFKSIFKKNRKIKPNNHKKYEYNKLRYSTPSGRDFGIEALREQIQYTEVRGRGHKRVNSALRGFENIKEGLSKIVKFNPELYKKSSPLGKFVPITVVD